jgi:retinol dehydrogenase-12
MSGNVALVTGANTGIGKTTARELARMGAHVFLACRSEEKTRPVMAEIAHAFPDATVEFLPLDLSDFASVRSMAREFLRRDLPLHLLVNNAGLGGGRGLTKSGFELHFGVNHMGHFLLTQLLLPRIQESPKARIVTLASRAHFSARSIDWEAVRRPTASRLGLAEYARSKLANVLFSAELARRVSPERITTYALHPGVVASDVWRRIPWPARALMKMFMISNEEGAKTSLYCATSPAVAHQTGLYYDECRVKEPSPAAQNEALAAKLWEWSEAHVA